VWALRRWGVLVYGFLPTVLGLVLALGLFAVLHATLNALTLGCIASLIGFGMDYAVHILQRAFNEHGRGTWTASPHIAIAETGGGLWLAALTTMACFVAFGTARQRFLHDLSWLAAVRMGLSCFLSVTFLPALLVRLPLLRHRRPPRALGLPTMLAAVCRFPRLILGLSLLLSLGALVALCARPPGFETDCATFMPLARPRCTCRSASPPCSGVRRNRCSSLSKMPQRCRCCRPWPTCNPP
jgi:predicted RND superfamily exporter protein